MWGAKPPTLLKGPPGPPRRARPKKRSQQIRPDCLQELRISDPQISDYNFVHRRRFRPTPSLLSVKQPLCPRSETESGLNPGGLPPPRPPGLGSCRPPKSPRLRGVAAPQPGGLASGSLQVSASIPFEIGGTCSHPAGISQSLK
jgi:hypothetical protein